MRRPSLRFVGFLFAFLFVVCGVCGVCGGCAQADNGEFTLAGPSRHDIGVVDGGNETTTTTSTNDGGRDTSSAIDSSTGFDTSTGEDTSVGYDTTVDDSGTGFDTYVPPPDTTPPPDDTSTAGPCSYCLGTCDNPIVDEDCFVTCIGGGATDCRVSGSVCTCIP